jgi:tetratricopeptide (TPR) repeat protein
MVICMLTLSEAPMTEQDAIASVYDQFRRSDYEAAVRDLQELVVRYPASTELRALYVNQLSLREPDRAQKLARELRYARPGDPWTWYAIASAGVLEPGTEHLAEGLETLEKMTSLAKEPLPDAMLRLKITALLRVGRVDDALAFLDEVEDRRSRLSGDAGQAGLPVLHLLRAMAREAAGEEEEAGALYRRAREAAPDDVRIGTSYVYAPSRAVDIGLGIGLTRDAPDFNVSVAFPFRFSLAPRRSAP